MVTKNKIILCNCCVATLSVNILVNMYDKSRDNNATSCNDPQRSCLANMMSRNECQFHFYSCCYYWFTFTSCHFHFNGAEKLKTIL